MLPTKRKNRLGYRAIFSVCALSNPGNHDQFGFCGIGNGGGPLGIVGYAHYFPFGSTWYPATQKVYEPYT